jgi:hypothetical protein
MKNNNKNLSFNLSLSRAPRVKCFFFVQDHVLDEPVFLSELLIAHGFCLFKIESDLRSRRIQIILSLHVYVS